MYPIWVVFMVAGGTISEGLTSPNRPSLLILILALLHLWHMYSWQVCVSWLEPFQHPNFLPVLLYKVSLLKVLYILLTHRICNSLQIHKLQILLSNQVPSYLPISILVLLFAMSFMIQTNFRKLCLAVRTFRFISNQNIFFQHFRGPLRVLHPATHVSRLVHQFPCTLSHLGCPVHLCTIYLAPFRFIFNQNIFFRHFRGPLRVLHPATHVSRLVH